MELTQHNLKYTHTKYCKAKQITTEAIEINKNKPLDDIEEIVEKTPAKREPPGLERAVSRIAEAVPILQDPSGDQIAQYLLNKNKALMTKKQEKCSCLSHQHYQKLINNLFFKF